MGKFLMSGFEVVSIGVAGNAAALEAMTLEERNAHLVTRVSALWADAAFNASSGAGVRGTTRLANLLPMGQTFLTP